MATLRREAVEVEAHYREVHGIDCDFVCRKITIIEPLDTPVFSMMDKKPHSARMHEWVNDELRKVEPHTGWWVRYVVKWWNDLQQKLTARKAVRP